MEKRLEVIYKENSRYVFNIALGMLKNRDDAEDITQNVFIKLFDSINSFRGDANIKTYLYRMTINRCIDLIRQRKMQDNKMDRIAQKNSVPADSGFILWDLLDKLDINHRAPLLLSEVGGFSYKEISKILEIKEGTVKSRVNRAINRLKDLIDKED
ncbi:MAG TPA: RNA polymerase sigma factor [bacterium]|nr:RNA polymerase sigma factor [bacterium]